MRIFEISSNADVDWVDEAAIAIQRDCQPYLRQRNGEIAPPLLRGIRPGSIYKSFTKHACPTGRNSTSTLDRIHWDTDNWFFEHFGIRYRSNAVFATGNPEQASSYGDLFLMFPIGTFEFVYSPTIRDLFDVWEDSEWKHSEFMAMGDEQLNSIVNNELTRGSYRSTSLEAAIKSRNEIMIHCDEYYLINIEQNIRYRMSALQYALDQI